MLLLGGVVLRAVMVSSDQQGNNPPLKTEQAIQRKYAQAGDDTVQKRQAECQPNGLRKSSRI